MTTAQPNNNGSAVNSNSPETKATPASTVAVDPKLTIQGVAKDIDKYLGKRVRWYGQQVASSAVMNINSHQYTVHLVYTDTNSKSPYGVNEFSVEYESGEASPGNTRWGWVTGTVAGKETIVVSSKTLPMDRGKPEEAPLLRDVTFETGNSPGVTSAAIDRMRFFVFSPQRK